MRRREFLSLPAAGALLAQQKKQDEVIATATQDTTPRVSIVLSSFKEGADHDGTRLPGLNDPRPADADLSTDQIQAMVRKAIDLAALRAKTFADAVQEEDWVVIKTHIPTCYGLDEQDGRKLPPYIPGTVTDPRIVRAVIHYLVEHKKGLRFTLVEGSPYWMPAERAKSATDGWSTDWGGTFGGLSYRTMIDELSRAHRGIRFEILDLNFAETVELPAPANPGKTYAVPKVIQQCDRLISIAPLKTDASTGVSLSMKNYLGIAPGSKYGFPKDGLGKMGKPDEVIVDLFSYHPADFAVLGGSWGIEGEGPEGPGAASVHHNLVLAGMAAPCVDAVAATLMGFDPTSLPFLRLAEEQGFGIHDVAMIWTRGNEIEEAKREFRKPKDWRPAKS